MPGLRHRGGRQPRRAPRVARRRDGDRARALAHARRRQRRLRGVNGDSQPQQASSTPPRRRARRAAQPRPGGDHAAAGRHHAAARGDSTAPAKPKPLPRVKTRRKAPRPAPPVAPTPTPAPTRRLDAADLDPGTGRGPVPAPARASAPAARRPPRPPKTGPKPIDLNADAATSTTRTAGSRPAARATAIDGDGIDLLVRRTHDPNAGRPRLHGRPRQAPGRARDRAATTTGLPRRGLRHRRDHAAARHPRHALEPHQGRLDVGTRTPASRGSWSARAPASTATCCCGHRPPTDGPRLRIAELKLLAEQPRPPSPTRAPEEAACPRPR